MTTVKCSADVPAERVGAAEGTSRQVLLGPSDGVPHFFLRKYRMEPGAGMPLHTNTVEHEQYVLAGRARIRIGDQSHEVGPGDCLFIPAGTPHDYHVVGTEPFVFLCAVPNAKDEIRMVERARPPEPGCC